MQFAVQPDKLGKLLFVHLKLHRKLVYKFITSLIIISFSSGFDSAIINVMATNVPSLNRLALFKNKTLFLSKNSKKRDAAIL